MRNRRTVVRFPVYNGYQVRVILANDVARTGRHLQVDLTATVAAFIADPVKLRGWLVLPATPDEATIAHEASHAVRAILAAVGARNDNENFAYHLDFLVGRIHKFIRRK